MRMRFISAAAALLLLLLATSCAETGDLPPVYQAPGSIAPVVEVDLIPVVEEFLRDCRGVDAARVDRNWARLRSVVYGPTTFDGETDRAAYCAIWGDGSREIVLNPRFTGSVRRALVYHELGHCLLDLDHHPESGELMSPAVPPSVTLDTSWDLLVGRMCPQRSDGGSE
jgi:hypothetical protein